MSCIFCDIINNKVPAVKIWEDEDFLAFLDVNPINPGHTLLVPKLHVEDVFDTPDDEFQKLFLASKKIAPAIKKATGAKRVGIAVEGFGVPHAHIHLVPINSGNELNPERARRADAKELEEMQELILDHFGTN